MKIENFIEQEEENKMANEDEQRWVSATLLNDESSTDEEIKSYFMKEGKMSTKKAEFYVKQRDKALIDSLRFKLKSWG